MEIKAADVMKLRKMTGAGMMDCKKALIEAEGDFARAQDIIREKGKLVVAKRADRTATEGVVVTKIVGQKAYILCLACETDFVAQNSEYSASAEAMLEVAVKNDAADRDALMAAKNAEGRTVEEMVTEKSGQTGEKIELAYYGRIEAPYCAAYVHFNKKLGTILGFNKEIPAEVAHTVLNICNNIGRLCKHNLKVVVTNRKNQSSALIDNLVAVVADFLEKLNSCFLKSALCKSYS